MIVAFMPLWVFGVLLVQSGQGGSASSAPSLASSEACGAVLAFGIGEEEYQVARWEQHVLVYRLYRGLPVLVSPEQLAFPGEGTVACRTAHGSCRLSASALKAHLMRNVLVPPEGQRLFAGCLRSSNPRNPRLFLQEADAAEERDSGRRIPVTGIQGSVPQRPLVILGTLEESPITFEQQNEPLLHVVKWVEI